MIEISKNIYYDKGQYFTTNLFLKSTINNLILNNPKLILEPAMGRGDLVEYVKNNSDNDIDFDLYEIDGSIEFLDCIDKSNIEICDFLKCNIDKKYDTIIGNPPFIKTKFGNTYLQFVNKCFKLLHDNGELIFIVPSDFFKLTSSGKIINQLMDNGTFTHIVHPNNERFFENANIDVLIFRYCKNKDLSKQVIFNQELKNIKNSNGILTFNNINNIQHDSVFSDFFDIYVGMVTGKENVFKNELLGNFNVLNGKNVIEKYILVHEFPTMSKDLNDYLLDYKSDLLNRKIRTFNDTNWFEWGALRNFKTISTNLGKECIYISTLTRSHEVAFVEKVHFFGGSLIIMIPKTEINLNKVVQYLNSIEFKKNYIYSGRFKIGHRQLCNAMFANN